MIFNHTKPQIGLLGLFVVASLIITSCNQDEDKLDVPASYEFGRNGASSVDFSGQTERLDMLSLLGTYLKTSNTVGSPALDASVLVDMFKNSNAPFGGLTFEKNLFSKCYAPDTSLFLQLLNEAALVSQTAGTASNGVAGVLVDGSPDPTIGYLVNENGIELTQVILKGMMGSIFYYQAMEVYLSGDRMNISANEELVAGKSYTEMEHYFDEAFGYFGVPTDFPATATLEDVRFWGEYCNSRNETLYPGMNDEIAKAFRTGRAAISAKDYDARDQAIHTIMEKWSVVAAASAINYLNQALSTAATPEYKRHHVMSEAIGFMMALKYHFQEGNSKFPPHYSQLHVNHALEGIGLTTNLYTVTDADILEAINHLREAFPEGQLK